MTQMFPLGQSSIDNLYAYFKSDYWHSKTPPPAAVDTKLKKKKPDHGGAVNDNRKDVGRQLADLELCSVPSHPLSTNTSSVANLESLFWWYWFTRRKVNRGSEDWHLWTCLHFHHCRIHYCAHGSQVPRRTLDSGNKHDWILFQVPPLKVYFRPSLFPFICVDVCKSVHVCVYERLSYILIILRIHFPD